MRVCLLTMYHLGQGTCKFAGVGPLSTGVARLGGEEPSFPSLLLTLCEVASNTTWSQYGLWVRADPKKASPVPGRTALKTDAEVKDMVTDPRPDTRGSLWPLPQTLPALLWR